jgi:hypothetical protein
MTELQARRSWRVTGGSGRHAAVADTFHAVPSASAATRNPQLDDVLAGVFDPLAATR